MPKIGPTFLQLFMLLIDEEAALSALSGMLPESSDERRKAFELIKKGLGAAGDVSEETGKRLNRIAALFRISEPRTVRGHTAAMAKGA